MGQINSSAKSSTDCVFDPICLKECLSFEIYSTSSFADMTPSLVCLSTVHPQKNQLVYLLDRMISGRSIFTGTNSY